MSFPKRGFLFEGRKGLRGESQALEESFVSFHRSAIIWESLAVTAMHIGKESRFHQCLGKTQIFLAVIFC